MTALPAAVNGDLMRYLPQLEKAYLIAYRGRKQQSMLPRNAAALWRHMLGLRHPPV